MAGAVAAGETKIFAGRVPRVLLGVLGGCRRFLWFALVACFGGFVGRARRRVGCRFRSRCRCRVRGWLRCARFVVGVGGFGVVAFGVRGVRFFGGGFVLLLCCAARAPCGCVWRVRFVVGWRRVVCAVARSFGASFARAGVCRRRVGFGSRAGGVPVVAVVAWLAARVSRGCGGWRARRGLSLWLFAVVAAVARRGSLGRGWFGRLGVRLALARRLKPYEVAARHRFAYDSS